MATTTTTEARGVAGRQELVDKLAKDVLQKQQRQYNDLLLKLALKHGWAVYHAVVARLVEMQSSLFQGQYRDKLGRTAYRVLGLTPEAEDEVVKAAYITLARKHHPDRGGNTEAMARINAAFQDIVYERGWVTHLLAAGEA